jgi:hypothetical protein
MIQLCTIKTSKKEIDQIFDSSNSPLDICLKLYKLVYPNYDDIKEIKGYPKINKEFSLYLFDKFGELDQSNGNTLDGSFFWMNKGFGTDEKLNDWLIYPAKYEI